MSRLDKLWSTRCGEFWKEALQYGSYVARSGFMAFLYAAFIVGIFFYNKVLETLPATFPYAWITTPVIVLAWAISPVRTFIKSADAVFLLPAENQMKAYFRKSWIYSFILQSVIVSMAGLAVYPLYRHCLGEHSEPLGFILLFLLLTKGLNLLSSWQEGRLVYKRHRNLIYGLRWLLALAGAYVVFVYGLLPAMVIILLSICLFLFLLNRLPHHTINLDHLIQTEKRHMAAHYLFFSWFIDVPQRATVPKHRIFWSQWTRLYAFQQTNSFLYLYTKTLLRSELFSILQRVTVLALIILFCTPDNTIKVIIYSVVIFISLIQCSALEQQHRYSFWLLLYPLQPQWRVQALSKIVFTATALQSFILAIALLCVEVPFMLAFFCFSASCLICALYCFILYPRKLRRRLF